MYNGAIATYLGNIHDQVYRVTGVDTESISHINLLMNTLWGRDIIGTAKMSELGGIYPCLVDCQNILNINYYVHEVQLS